MDFSLIETLRWEPGTGFVRLERHLARLARSAEALGLPGAEGARDALFAALPPSALPGISPALEVTRPYEGKSAPHPLLPSGRRGRQADEGDAGERMTSPLIRPFGPPSPRGEKGTSGNAEPHMQSLSPMDRRAEGGAPQPHPLRIRLELFADGRIDVQTAAFTPLAADAVWRVKLATTRLSSPDPLLRHKTSRRALYAAARAEFPTTEADEVILLNERGELCEGTITSLFLDDGTGPLKAPPLASGLLAGILREELLETGSAIEAVLRPGDLAGGTILVGNSLRGLIRCVLAEGATAA